MRTLYTGLIFCSLLSYHGTVTSGGKPTPPRAKVTVKIDRLKAVSKDACNGIMDFKATVRIGADTKNFPVVEGNDIRPRWEFSIVSIQKQINIRIEIRDDDDALCGGGDDVVIVDPAGAGEVTISFDPGKPATKTSTLRGKKISGKEQGEIKFTVTIEPV